MDDCDRVKQEKKLPKIAKQLQQQQQHNKRKKIKINCDLNSQRIDTHFTKSSKRVCMYKDHVKEFCPKTQQRERARVRAREKTMMCNCFIVRGSSLLNRTAHGTTKIIFFSIVLVFFFFFVHFENSTRT